MPTTTIATPTCRLKSFCTYKSSCPQAMQCITLRQWPRDGEMRTSCSLPQRVQLTRSTGSVPSAISALHERHLNSIMGAMKPLILLLLFAISSEAQSLPEIARKERERKAQQKSSHALIADTPKPPEAAP